MQKNAALFVLIVLVGMGSALWIDANQEYMPYETITVGVSGAGGVLSVDVYDETGVQVFHEMRTVETEGSGGYRYYSYETFEFELPYGQYTLIAKDNDDSEEAGFRVSSIGLAAVIGEEGLGLFMHKEDGSPIESGRIILTYAGEEEDESVEVEAFSGKGGIFRFETENLEKIRGELAGESAEIEVYDYYLPAYYKYNYWYQGYTGYIFSDKELYQPGETAHVSAVIFMENESVYETIEGGVEVEVRDPDYMVAYSSSVAAVNSRISFDVPITEEAALGGYSIELRKNDTYVGWYYFEVQEYKRPEIQVALVPLEGKIAVNDTMRVNISTKYYFGGDADAEVKFQITRAPHYWPYYRYYCYCPWYWEKQVVAEGLLYTEGGSGMLEWSGANESGDYQIKVWATDESEVVSEAETTVSVLNRVNLEALIPEMSANESASITLLTYDYMDEPLELDGSLRIYEYPDYYTYYYDDEEYEKNATLVFEGNFSTEDGAYTFEFTPENPGPYLLEAEAGGEKLEKSFYVPERDWWNWNYLETGLDKDEYGSGEKMQLTVTSPIAGSMIAISTGSAPRVEWFQIKPGINQLEMEAVETSSLNFYIIKDGERYNGYESYMVRDENWVEVGLEHGDVYRPGDTATITISAERDGMPSNASASIAIVDQAIIDLSGAQWRDIYSYFYSYPRHTYRVIFSWEGYGYIYPMVLEEAGGDIVMAESMEESDARATSKEEIEVREKFVETALWIPYVMLKGGEKQVVWHIPDTLTTWNMTVVANEGAGVGMASSSAIVTKDVIGRLSPPSALVADDAIAIPATIFNYGEKRETFKVTLETSGNLEVIGSPIRYVSLEPGESRAFYMPVKATEAGEAELLLWVEGGEGDAVKLPIEVKELGVETVEAEAGVVGANEEKTLKYTAPDDAEVRLSLHSSVLSSAFDSLDYLVSYPYGCIEQTMSGFLPDVVLTYALSELKLEYTGEENVSALVDEGLQKIYSHQNADGSWGWFRGTDARISAYVMDGLTIAKKAGVEVNEEVYSSGLEWLRSNADTSYSKFVLNRIESARVSEYTDDAFGALAACDDGNCARLVSALECAGDYCMLEYDGDGWYHSDTELTSYAVESLVDSWDFENARKCVNWLMMEKRGRYWRSTKDTARTVLALTEYAKQTGELESDYVAYVYLDGEKIYEGRMGHKAAGGEEIELPAGEHELRVGRSGFGPLYYGLSERYYTDEIPEGEIEVERSYEKTVAKVGDEITVSLRIVGNGEYFAIEDPIPAGTEIVKEEERYWWYYGGYRMEARQDRAVYFFDSLDGETEVNYTLRVTNRGDFTALPTHAYNMYAPEAGGYSEFTHFTFYEKAYIEPYVTESGTTLRVQWDGEGPALLRVELDGVETEYEISPGENEIVLEAGAEAELSYTFESEEEYYEVEAQEGAGRGEESWLAALVLIGGIAAVAVIYLWGRK